MIDTKSLFGAAKAIVKCYLGRRTPIKVTQYITLRCNLDCEYCGRKNISVEELSTDEVKFYIREFRKLGTLFWSFNGGECLLREDIGELINYAKEQCLKCNIVTNGVLVPRKIESLKKLDLVVTSIDGPEDVQDKIRGKGIFKKNIEALDVLARNKIKTVIVTTISNENIDKLDEVLKLAQLYGHSWDVQPVVIHRGDKEQKAKEYQFDVEKFKEAIDWIIHKKKEGAPIFSAFSYLEDMRKFPNCEANDKCWASRLFCVIGPDGSFYPCAEFVGTELYKKTLTDHDIKQTFLSLPDMWRCRNCYFSCYSEYNLLLNHKVRSGFKVLKNLLNRRWFWS
ncbi:MAG: radical SAM protein [Candidatus Omnitrophica bacterium]|nr:radical SAM protein [Candidatus Omnitrophota bacterium]